MNNNTLATQIAELDNAYEFFCNRFKFVAGLEQRPIITLQSQGRKSVFGWFGPERWEKNGQSIHEINIAVEHLKRPVTEILETLLHEMAHLKNRVAGVNDCNAAQYHNKHFKTSAESFALVVERMQPRGWAKTYLGDQAAEAVDAWIGTMGGLEKITLGNISRIDTRGSKEGTAESKYTTVTLPKELGEQLKGKLEEDEKLSTKVRELVEDYLKTELAVIKDED